MTKHIPFLLRVNRLEDAEKKMLDYANEIHSMQKRKRGNLM